MALPITLTDATFRTEVIDAETPTLVFFWADWNSTCKAMSPTIRRLAEEDSEHLRVGRLDVDANPVIPSMFGITMVPSLMLFRAGQALFRIVGYRRIDVVRAEIEAALVGV